jgi:uncharacterized membrane protein
MANILSRLRNYGTLIAIAALVLDILMFNGTIDLPMADKYESFVQRGLELLMAAGIINNPTTLNKGFGDDK